MGSHSTIDPQLVGNVYELMDDNGYSMTDMLKALGAISGGACCLLLDDDGEGLFGAISGSVEFVESTVEKISRDKDTIKRTNVTLKKKKDGTIVPFKSEDK